jgi:four helix bundle protein
MRRSASSIPANVAEGYGRETTPMFIQFLRVAQGSLKELETHIMLAERVPSRLRSGAGAPLLADCDRIGRMLRNLIRSLQAKDNTT